MYCTRIRRVVLELIYRSGYGFLGSCFSCVELLVAATQVAIPGSRCSATKLILSKGHAAPVLYAILNNENNIESRIAMYGAFGSNLEGHPNARLMPSVGASTGSLGLGMAIAVGRAIGARIAKEAEPTIVIAGDAEMQEGICWEALQIAGRLALSNLFVLIDNNEWQSVGPTPPSLSVPDQCRAAGWDVVEIDGHSISAIVHALNMPRSNRPRSIIAATHRGYGFVGYPKGAAMSWIPDEALYRMNAERLSPAQGS
jgi:transketolase